MCHECWITQNLRHLNVQRKDTAGPPSTWVEHTACASRGTKPQSIDPYHKPQTSSPNAIIELISRVNEANIFMSNIWVTALIDTGAQVSTITKEFCEQHGYDIPSVQQMLN